MVNVFVITDNPAQYSRVREIINQRSHVSAEYFCSQSSDKLFHNEIEIGAIKTLDLRKGYGVLHDYDVGFSIHSKQIFPSDLVSAVRCINIHPGYNPQNRGWYPQVFSLINGKQAGATIHIMDEKIDHGPILFQEKVSVESFDTSKDIYERVLDCEIRLFSQNFDYLISPDCKGFEVKEEGNYNSIQDFKNLCEIDLAEVTTYKQAIDKLRALTHPPYENAYFRDESGKRIFISLRLSVDQTQPCE